MTTPFLVEALGQHDRSAFTCGEPALDSYLRTQASQDIKRRVANCFVAVETATSTLAGFYTLSAASIPLTELPDALSKRLPRYPSVPAVRIGRLAIGTNFQGRGLGAALLADALHRTLHAPAAAYAILVDAKNEHAVSFYERHQFQRFVSQPMTLFVAVETARKAFNS